MGMDMQIGELHTTKNNGRHVGLMFCVKGAPCGRRIDGNSYHFSGGRWSVFCLDVGISPLLFVSEEGDRILPLGKHHDEACRDARETYRARNVDKRNASHDMHLNILDYLCFWVGYALEHCNNPSVMTG